MFYAWALTARIRYIPYVNTAVQNSTPMQAEHGVRQMPRRRFSDGDPLIVAGAIGMIAWTLMVVFYGLPF